MPPNQEFAVINNKLQHIDEAIIGMTQTLKDILEKVNHQNGSLIEAKKDIEFLKSEIKENKEEREKEIKILWEELRRKEESRKEDEKSRDVKQRWWVTTIMGGIVIIWGIIQYLLK